MRLFGRKKSEGGGKRDPLAAALEELGDARENVRQHAAKRLAAAGQVVVPLLLSAADDRQAERAWQAQNKALDALGSPVRSGVMQVISDLNSEDAQRRRKGNRALKRLPAQAREAVQGLARLKEESTRAAQRRREAVRLLGEIGRGSPEQAAIAQALVRALADSMQVADAVASRCCAPTCSTWPVRSARPTRGKASASA